MATANISALSHRTQPAPRRFPLLKDRGRSISPINSFPSRRSQIMSCREGVKAKEMALRAQTTRRSVSPIPLKLRIMSAAVSQAGKLTPTQTACFDRTHGRCHLLGVCDGYGPNGFLVSAFLSIKLPAVLFRKVASVDIESVKAALKAAYRDCEELLEGAEVDISKSGCGCLTLLFINSTLLCANIGTSRAVIGRLIHSTWAVYQLSWDTASSCLPSAPSNIRRLKRGKLAMEEGKKAGFGMSQASSVQPDIEAVEIGAGDRFVIIGTQELWQVMTSWEAVQLVAGLLPHKPTSLCESLITEAQKRWEEIGGCVAEITVIIALFGP